MIEKTRSSARILAVCALAMTLFAYVTARPVAAQTLYGSIVGAIDDPSGSAVPKATVTITNKATGVNRSVEADDQGRYALLNVAAGSYDLKVTMTGFRTVSKTNVEVAINTVTRENVRLEVGALAEQVTVEAQAALLQTDKSDVRHEITGKTIQNLPLPAYRNYQSLVALVPGATPPAFQNAVVDTPGRALRSFVNGTATNNNNPLVDGAVNINIWLPHHVARAASMFD